MLRKSTCQPLGLLECCSKRVSDFALAGDQIIAMTRLWWSGGRDNTTSASLQVKSCSIRVLFTLFAGKVQRDWALETFRQTSPHFRKMPKLEPWNCRKRLVQEIVSFLILFLQRAFVSSVQIDSLWHPGKRLHTISRSISRHSCQLIADAYLPLFRRYCYSWISADTFLQPSRRSPFQP
jgi:hypothetical protein